MKIGRVLQSFMVLSFMAQFVSAAWWNTDWNYKQDFTVNTSVNTWNASVLLNITFDSNMQADFDDLRFIVNDSIEIPFYIDNVVASTYADVWISAANTSEFGGNNYSVYYGNASATDDSNLTAKFRHFIDDFDRADSETVGNGWNEEQTPANLDIASELLRVIDESGATATVINHSGFDSFTRVDIRLNISTLSPTSFGWENNDGSNGGFFIRFGNVGNFIWFDGASTHDVGDYTIAQMYNWSIQSINHSSHTYNWLINETVVVTGADFNVDINSANTLRTLGSSGGQYVASIEFVYIQKEVFDAAIGFDSEENFLNAPVVVPTRGLINDTINITWTDVNDSDGVDTMWFNVTKPVGVDRIDVTEAINVSFLFNNTTVDGAYSVIGFYNDTLGNMFASPSVAFVINNSTFNETFIVSPFETSTGLFSLRVNVSGTITDANASLILNGTIITPNKTSSGTSFNFTVLSRVPLITTNETQFPHFWNLNLTDSSEENITTLNQTIRIAYIANNLTVNQSVIFSGQTFIATFTTTDLAGTSFDTELIEFNNTNETANPIQLTAPHLGLTENNKTFTLTGFYVINDTDNSKTLTSQTTINVTSFGVTNCSAGSFSTNVSLTFFHMSEDNDSLLNTSDAEAWFNVTTNLQSQAFGFTFTNQENFTICIFPDNLDLVVDSTIIYSSDDHEERTYFLDNATITSTNQNITLYHTLSSLSTNVTILVQEDTGVALEDHLVHALRFFPGEGEGVFKTVEIGKTNAQGRAFMSIQREEIYLWRIVLDGQILAEFGPQEWGPLETSLTIKVTTGTSGEWFTYEDSVAHSCTIIESPGSITCSITDTSGLQVQACLDVSIVNVSGMFLNSSQCSTSASATFVFTVPNESLKYYYTLRGTYQLTDNIWESGYWDFPGIPEWGDIGIVIAITLIIMLSLGAGAIGKEFMIIGALLGLIIVWGSGVVALGTGETYSIILLGVVAIYLFTRGK